MQPSTLPNLTGCEVSSQAPPAASAARLRPFSVVPLTCSLVSPTALPKTCFRLPMICLATPTTLSCPCYLVLCFVVGGEGAGCGCRTVAPAWVGFFSAFGFLASRLLRLRPLANVVLPVKQLLVRSALRRVLLRAVRQHVPGSGDVLSGAGGRMTCTQQRHGAHQGEESEGD